MPHLVQCLKIGYDIWQRLRKIDQPERLLRDIRAIRRNAPTGSAGLWLTIGHDLGIMEDVIGPFLQENGRIPTHEQSEALVKEWATEARC